MNRVSSGPQKLVVMGPLSWLLMTMMLVEVAQGFILNSELRATSRTTAFVGERVFSDVEGFMQFPDDQITTSSKWGWFYFRDLFINCGEVYIIAFSRDCIRETWWKNFNCEKVIVPFSMILYMYTRL